MSLLPLKSTILSGFSGISTSPLTSVTVTVLLSFSTVEVFEQPTKIIDAIQVAKIVFNTDFLFIYIFLSIIKFLY